jgi:hypothetical protein
MNRINNFMNNMPPLAELGLDMACPVIAATALGGPVGLGGALLFGATKFIAKGVVSNVCDKVFNTDKPNASGVSDLFSKIAKFALSSFIAMGVLSLAGMQITFSAALVLSAVSALIAFSIAVLAFTVLAICAAVGISAAMKSFQNLNHQQHHQMIQRN